MKKLMYLFLLVAFSLNAVALEHLSVKSEASKSQISKYLKEIDKISDQDPNELIQLNFLGKKNKSSTYPSGDLYILLGIGKKDEQMTKKEYQDLWRIMNYLADSGFRVMINVKAKVDHLREAVANVDTSLIMFSGHGNRSAFYDYDSKPVPYDIFDNKHSNFYQFVLSACYGRIALNNNYDISGLKTWAWSGLTNSTEFINFLVSSDWNAFDGL